MPPRPLRKTNRKLLGCFWLLTVPAAALAILAGLVERSASEFFTGVGILLVAFVPEILRAKLEKRWLEKERFDKILRTESMRFRVLHRDAEYQDRPYTYRCEGHPNSTLAIRYGIANLTKETKKYWHHRADGTRVRKPEKDQVVYRPSDEIGLRKIKRLEGDHYLAELPDFGNRKVRVVIEQGSEYIKTFYPLDPDWFDKHADLELVLKDNSTFTLKELAMLHVQKAVKTS